MKPIYDKYGNKIGEIDENSLDPDYSGIFGIILWVLLLWPRVIRWLSGGRISLFTAFLIWLGIVLLFEFVKVFVFHAY